MVAQIVEPLTRLNPDVDMPRGLEPIDVTAYRRGYSRGCLTYVRKHGAPAAQHERGTAPAAGTDARRALGVQLAEDMRAHELERHPSAHRAGMSALNKSRKLRGLEPAADPCKPARRPAARKLAAVPAPVDVAPAPAPRKRSKLTACERHAGTFAALTMRERVRLALEGGPAGGCVGDPCELLPGTDYVTAEMCTGPYPLTWTTGTVTLTAAPAGHGITAEEVRDAVGGRGRVERVEVPATVPAPMPAQTPAAREASDRESGPRNTRRAARRKLADEMRARGEDPRDADAWAAAKLAAGVK